MHFLEHGFYLWEKYPHILQEIYTGLKKYYFGLQLCFKLLNFIDIIRNGIYFWSFIYYYFIVG